MVDLDSKIYGPSIFAGNQKPTGETYYTVHIRLVDGEFTTVVRYLCIECIVLLCGTRPDLFLSSMSSRQGEKYAWRHIKYYHV